MKFWHGFIIGYVFAVIISLVAFLSVTPVCPETQKLVKKKVEGHGKTFEVEKCVNKEEK